jgi:hypothetical protein
VRSKQTDYRIAHGMTERTTAAQKANQQANASASQGVRHRFLDL